MGLAMKKLDERVLANMEVVLDDVFRAYPHGGDHESRKRVARKLLRSVKQGNKTLSSLTNVAKSARVDQANGRASH